MDIILAGSLLTGLNAFAVLTKFVQRKYVVDASDIIETQRFDKNRR